MGGDWGMTTRMVGPPRLLWGHLEGPWPVWERWGGLGARQAVRGQLACGAPTCWDPAPHPLGAQVQNQELLGWALQPTQHRRGQDRFPFQARDLSGEDAQRRVAAAPFSARQRLPAPELCLHAARLRFASKASGSASEDDGPGSPPLAAWHGER